jgi:hypothetical protein
MKKGASLKPPFLFRLKKLYNHVYDAAFNQNEFF